MGIRVTGRGREGTRPEMKRRANEARDLDFDRRPPWTWTVRNGPGPLHGRPASDITWEIRGPSDWEWDGPKEYSIVVR